MRLLEMHTEISSIEFFDVMDLAHTLWNLHICVTPSAIIVVHHVDLWAKDF
jgi:hypothetical protein